MNLRCVCGLLIGVLVAGAQEHKTRNIIFVMTDGLRWQDTFRGADPALLDKKHGGVANPNELQTEFWRPDAKARRETLLPFLWTVVARDGQI